MRIAAIISMIVLCGLTKVHAEPLSRSATIDVTVSSTGEFVSQCQDAAGHGVAGADVALYRFGSRYASTTSAPDGWFTIRGVRPGVYELKSGDWQHAVRVWTPETAPPSASDPIALILDGPTPKYTAEPATVTFASSSKPMTANRPPSDEAAVSPIVAVGATTTDESAIPDAAATSTVPATAQESVVELTAAERRLTKPDVSNEPFNPFAHAPLPGDTPAPAPPLPDLSEPSPTEPQTSEPQGSDAPTSDELTSVTPTPEGQVEATDELFNPFYETASFESEPLLEPGQEELAPPPVDAELAPEPVPDFYGGDPQLQGAGPVASPPPPGGNPPPTTYPSSPAYQTGPTVGDVVTASAVVGGIAVGAVAIYRYDNRRESVRIVVSP